jgi:hypothetical protein
MIWNWQQLFMHWKCGGIISWIKFVLRINHIGLKYFFGKPTMNARQTRWMEFLSEYDIDIKHIKGKANKVNDALYKRVHEMHDTTINMYNSNLKRRILEAVTIDQHYVQVKESLHQSNVQHKFKDYRMEEDRRLLYRNKFYVLNSQELRNLVLKEMYNVPYTGGTKKQVRL